MAFECRFNYSKRFYYFISILQIQNWLKIVADGINPNEIKVLGSLKIDSVKDNFLGSNNQ